MATFSDFELQQARNFFAGGPSPNEIYERASSFGLSPTQLSSLYSQATGANQAQTLADVNAYLISGNRALPGGYVPMGTSTSAPTPAPITLPTRQTFQPYEIQAAREFFGTRPSPNQIFTRASELGLSAPQLADLFTASMGGDFGQNLAQVQNYLSGAGQTLFGGYVSPTPTPVSPPAPPPPTTTLAAQPANSRIDPALYPFLQRGLSRAEQLFQTGAGPQLYPEQMFVSPSAQTLSALASQERLASAASQPVLEQAQRSYLGSLIGLGETARGGFLSGSPYRQALISAATRPLVQEFTQSVLPGIASGFSRAGRYGSGAMERAQSAATEAFGRSVGDVASQIAAQDYARERGLQQQAQVAQSAIAQAAPSFFQASFLPSQALAQAGASREAIAAQPLQERIQRYQYAQQLPYQQLQGFLSSIYGTPMASSQAIIPQAQTNRMGQAIGLGTLGYLGGSFYGNTPLNQPGQAAILGALGGGLLGGLR